MSNNTIQDIAAWKESLTRMDDSRFFNLMRLYLGEIKTPYNKQKLIEALSAFLQKKENRSILLTLLSANDLTVISAIIHIAQCTEEKLLSFFASDFSFTALHDILINLEERLVLYRCMQKGEKNECYAVNPLIQQDVQKLAVIRLLLPPNDYTPPSCAYAGANNGLPATHNILSDTLIACWYCFVCSYPDLCRSDGNFKKKTEDLLHTRFSSIPQDFLQRLHTACINLSLFNKNETECKADNTKWQSFACLSRQERIAYIISASCGRFTRSVLQKNAELVLALINAISPEGCSRRTFLRTAFLSANRQTAQSTASKKKLFLKSADADSPDYEGQTFSAQNALNALTAFGFVHVYGAQKTGTRSDNTAASATGSTGTPRTGSADDIILHAQRTPFKTEAAKQNQKNEYLGALNIDAGFTVTLLRELPFELLIDTVHCMDLVFCDTVSRFEITRDACFRAFKTGFTVQNITALFEKTVPHKLPQNLIFSLNDWYKLYNSAKLIKGYVLRAAQDKRLQVEHNPVLSPYISETLADGVYVLNFSNDEEAARIIKKSALAFIGTINTAAVQTPQAPPFSPLDSAALLNIPFTEYEKNTRDEKDAEKKAALHLQQMKEAVSCKNLDNEQKKELLLRIKHKTILTPAQLEIGSLRTEKTEASGMDLLGKLYVIEKAISSYERVELTYADTTVCGVPITTEKKGGDIQVVLKLEHTGAEQTVSVARARSVKRMRTSVLNGK